MSDDAKPVGSHNLAAFGGQPAAGDPNLPPARTQEWYAPRNPSGVGNAGDRLSDVCQWCLNPFSYTVSRSGTHRTSVEYDRLKRALHIKEDVRPVICEPCYKYVVGTAENATLGFEQPGWTNGLEGCKPNVVLRTMLGT